MKRVVKKKDSEILTQKLNYIIGNSNNNKKIATILYQEQKGFCAYTETFIGRTDAKDIEHFNPTLKGKETDSYQNWFLVKHQWNKEKASKWGKYQPILNPTDTDFESRVLYLDGDYYVSDPSDKEAKNLIDLLKLDDPVLADERKKYLKRKRKEIEIFGETPKTFFETLIEDEPEKVSFLRAIDKEFNITIWDLIPEIK